MANRAGWRAAAVVAVAVLAAMLIVGEAEAGRHLRHHRHHDSPPAPPGLDGPSTAPSPDFSGGGPAALPANGPDTSPIAGGPEAAASPNAFPIGGGPEAGGPLGSNQFGESGGGSADSADIGEGPSGAENPEVGGREGHHPSPRALTESEDCRDSPPAPGNGPASGEAPTFGAGPASGQVPPFAEAPAPQAGF